MKQLLLSFALVLVSVVSYAAAPSLNLSQSSSTAKALGSAWKNQQIKPQQVIPPKQEKDITMVYGGEDISRRFTIIPHTTIA